MELEQLKYPVGKYRRPETISPQDLSDFREIISAFPGKIGDAVTGLTDDQLNTAYRPEGWTIRQVVHHCADSHMNSLTRFKLALTEENPVIKPYNEALWAELADSKTLSISSSLQMIAGIHARWSALLEKMSPTEYEKSFVHPETGRHTRLDQACALYAWHCRHHLAHITTLKERMGW